MTKGLQNKYLCKRYIDGIDIAQLKYEINNDDKICEEIKFSRL